MDMVDLFVKGFIAVCLLTGVAIAVIRSLVFYKRKIAPLVRRNELFREFCENATDKRRLRILHSKKVFFSKRRILRMLFILAEEYYEMSETHYLLFEQLARFGPISSMLADELVIAYDRLGYAGLKEMEEILGYFVKSQLVGASQQTNSS